MDGVDWIKRAVEVFGGQVEILPGGGVRPENVRRLVDETGVKSVHFSVFKTVGEGYSGIPLTEPDPGRILAMREALV